MALAALLPAFRYVVLLKDSASLLTANDLIGGALVLAGGGFSECTGIEVNVDIFTYPEGGQNTYVHRLPTRTNHADIVLKRGLLLATELWLWIQDTSRGRYSRKDGYILMLTPSGIPAQAWIFRRGLPMKWSGPSLVASQDAVATETLTIAHEGLDQLGLTTALGAI